MDHGPESAAEAPPSRRPRGRLRAPWGLLGMLALVAAAEAAISARDLDFTEVWHWDWRVFGRTVAARARGRDVLFFGDSQLKFGLLPPVVRDRSGLSAFNFAIHVGQPSSSYFLLRRALDGGARPEAVVFDSTPHLLRQRPDENGNLWGELLRPAEALDLAWTMGGDAGFFARTMAARTLASYRERHEIRKSVAHALRGGSSSMRSIIPRFHRNWKVNQGAQLMGDGPDPAIDASWWAGHLYPRWEPDPANLAYLDRFLELAQSRRIAVLWYLPPVHPGVQAATEASGFDADYTRFVRGVQARSPGVCVIDARKAGLSADMFSDGIHPNRRGALRLSAAMGDLLRDRKAVQARGWVALDASSSRPYDRPAEDVDQSGAVLRASAEGGARR